MGQYRAGRKLVLKKQLFQACPDNLNPLHRGLWSDSALVVENASESDRRPPFIHPLQDYKISFGDIALWSDPCHFPHVIRADFLILNVFLGIYFCLIPIVVHVML